MPIASRQFVQEIPQLPKGTAAILKEIFHVNLSEYALLVECQRDDNMKFGLDPRHVSPQRKQHLATLREKAYIEYSEYTGKWELTTAGRAVLVTAPVVLHNTTTTTLGKAEVIPFPVKQATGNSA